MMEILIGIVILILAILVLSGGGSEDPTFSRWALIVLIVGAYLYYMARVVLLFL